MTVPLEIALGNAYKIMKNFSAYYVSDARALARGAGSCRFAFAPPGEHFDSPRPLPVASFQANKVAHYNGKIKRKSKV